MRKITFAAGFATGYVLGARAGRARYEQIRDAARAFASNPTVQSTASTVQHQASDALSTAKDKAASSLGSTLHDKRPSWLGGSSSTTTTMSTESAYPSGTNGRPA